MNTRTELKARLEEIQRAAAALPDYTESIAEIYYALSRLVARATMTINFLTTLEMKPDEGGPENGDCVKGNLYT